MSVWAIWPKLLPERGFRDNVVYAQSWLSGPHFGYLGCAALDMFTNSMDFGGLFSNFWAAWPKLGFSWGWEAALVAKVMQFWLEKEPDGIWQEGFIQTEHVTPNLVPHPASLSQTRVSCNIPSFHANLPGSCFSLTGFTQKASYPTSSREGNVPRPRGFPGMRPQCSPSLRSQGFLEPSWANKARKWRLIKQNQ